MYFIQQKRGISFGKGLFSQILKYTKMVLVNDHDILLVLIVSLLIAIFFYVLNTSFRQIIHNFQVLQTTLYPHILSVILPVIDIFGQADTVNFK